MAFSDFKTVPEVQEIFKITHVQDDFVPEQGLKPSEHFLQEFGLKRQHIDVFASEGARCETLIFPILWEIYKGYTAEYSLWIRKSIAYDETLSGTPDYFVSTRSKLGIRVVGSPLIIIVEAKKNDFEQGWGQCLSELIAAQKIKTTDNIYRGQYRNHNSRFCIFWDKNNLNGNHKIGHYRCNHYR